MRRIFSVAAINPVHKIASRAVFSLGTKGPDADADGYLAGDW